LPIEQLDAAFGPRAKAIFPQVEYVRIVACGTSYHSGVVAQYFIEQICRIPCRVEIASEYRYRNAVVPRNTLFVTISQSGETADTLAALRLAKQSGFCLDTADAPAKNSKPVNHCCV
jgi:glucosamine--fructose-6-phosphate aminotransferase (isomerizing)